MAAGIRITGYGKIINAWNGTCSPNLKRKGPTGESYSHLSRGRPPQGLETRTETPIPPKPSFS